AVGAVHMNGRLYDPALGRFLRADPFVQFPANLQSHNRYSYALNNPLAYTDPSGYFLKGLLRPLASIAISVWLPGAGIWTGTGLFAANGIGAVAASGFIAGAVGSGSLKGAVIGAFSAAAFNGVGDIGFKETFVGSSLKALTHGAVGGITSMLGGGRFGHGFISAAGAQALSGPIGRLGNRFQRTAAAAAVGGTLSAATGGKFANGAVTGAFSRAFNDELHGQRLQAA
ncbi:MAG: type IV secretion protein Rhs, partial [Gammaproteobacteria bacterium]|nr:type IV secretion protein Rhs [Gammaproteobacteria bacterium]